MGPRAAYPDAALIAESLRCPQAFAVVFDRHYEPVHGYLARRVGVDRADDLAAQTFMVAFERRASFRAELSPTARPWLLGIATNLLRTQWRVEQQALGTLAELAAGAVAEGRESEAEVSELGDALASLDADQRDVLLLHAWEGLRYGEIATALGIPVGTVRSRLARARARLRLALEGRRGVPTTRSEVWP